MSDLISRQAAIDAMANTLWHYPNECYRNLNEYEFAKGLAELGLKSVPSAQPEQRYTEEELRVFQHVPKNKESGYDEIIKDINDPDTDMPTIMFDSQKNLGKAIWQPCKINNQDCLNFTLVND